MRIGQSQFQTFIAGISGVNEGGTISAVYINTDGQLGTQPPPSSRRFKDSIKQMDQASEAILSLRPVTFRYKSDTKGIVQFGLVAEEVAKVNPDLVVRDADGTVYSVRYEAVNAMLLNEFLKEHRTVKDQGATINELKGELANLTAVVKEQAAQIHRLSVQMQSGNAASQVVLKNP
jgi:Chaperone of endosialidase